jgi:hypothetical protein
MSEWAVVQLDTPLSDSSKCSTTDPTTPSMHGHGISTGLREAELLGTCAILFKAASGNKVLVS